MIVRAAKQCPVAVGTCTRRLWRRVLHDAAGAFSQRASIKDFAEEKVEAGTWAEEEAQQLAEESYERYLPEGLDTPGAYLYRTARY